MLQSALRRTDAPPRDFLRAPFRTRPDGPRSSAPAEVSDPGVMQFATSTDPSYLPFVAVLASTLACHRAPGRTITLSVLHSGVSAADQERVAGTARGIDLHWHEITTRLSAAGGDDLAELAGRPHYYRCLLPDVLPAGTRRVVYLDADILVRGDLTALWQADLGGAPVGAVTDSLGSVARAVDRWRALGLDGDAPYFNSGVMVIDLDAWRTADSGWEAVRRCAADRAHLLAQGRWPQHDQYGLNVVFHQRWQALPRTWNYFTYLRHRPAKVLHFLGSSGRPGSRYCHPRYTLAFLGAVDRTPWRGWRPDSVQRGWLWRAARQRLRERPR